MISLYPHQQTNVDEIRSAFRTHRRVLLQAPTGYGKTVVFTHIATSASRKGKTVTIVAHRREIVEQISEALDSLRVRHGMIVPGAVPTDDPVQVGMIQTATRRDLPAPDLMIVDECHHATSQTYTKLTNAWGRSRILGVSATPARLDGRPLSDAFDVMVQGPPMRWLIENGFLARYELYAPPPKVDLSGVTMRVGDYSIDEMSNAMDQATITGDAVTHYAEALNGRPAVAFCCTVKHAEHVAAGFRAQGWRASSIDGKMDRHQRRALLDGLATGQLNVLTSAELISEGVDVPVCAGAILLRPTKSVTVYLQQVGRALRRKADGSGAVILDHVGNSETHGMPDDPRIWSLEGRVKTDAMATTTCKRCYRTFERGEARDCGDMDCPATRAGGTVERALPEQVEGRLRRMSDPWEWAKGIDVTGALGAEYRELLKRAGGDLERLRMISRARGYKRGWASRMAKEHAIKVQIEKEGFWDV